VKKDPKNAQKSKIFGATKTIKVFVGLEVMMR